MDGMIWQIRKMDEAELLNLNRRVALGLIGAGTVCASRDGLAAILTGQPSIARPAMPLSRMGVDRFSGRDQWRTLLAAFQAASAEGFDLLGDPDANYRHDGALELNGVSFDGRGATFTAMSDGPQAMRLTGSGWRLANLTTLGSATRRSSEDSECGIWVGSLPTPTANFLIENVVVGAAAPGRGFACAGFMFNNATQGDIRNIFVAGTRADGIHVTNGSSDLNFIEPSSRSTGDDGFAVVSYRRQGALCRRVRVSGGQSHDAGGRGFAVVGGTDIVYERPFVSRSAAAGLYLYGEGSYDTYGVLNCHVLDAQLQDCVTGSGLPPGYRNAAIILGGRGGSDTVGGQVVGRGVAGCTVRNPSVVGSGAACSAGISTHEYAVAPVISGARLSRLVSPRGRNHPNGIEIGGRDVTFDEVDMQEIGGIPIVGLPTASGRCVLRSPRVNGGRIGGGAIDSHIYFEAAPHLAEMVVEGGEFARGPRRLAISRLAPGRLRLARNLLDGIATAVQP